MSKTTNRPNSEATPEGRELRDDELDHVSGGGKRRDGRVAVMWPAAGT